MSTCPEGDKTSIWLDCDTGHDDAYAILLAAHHPSSHLLGISTTHGNAPVESTTQNTLSILHAIGLANRIPVIRGSARPLARDPKFAPSIHGESGLGLGDASLLPDSRDAKAQSDDLGAAVHAIMLQPAGTVSLVATGSLTNIARMLHLEPRLAQHIRAISIMGGVIGGGFTNAPLGRLGSDEQEIGNWGPYAEFNIIADPEAAKQVSEMPTLQGKLIMMPLDVTHSVLGNDRVVQKLFGPQHGELSKVRRLFKEVLLFFAATYRDEFGMTEGPPLHDPLSVWAVLYPSGFEDRPRDEKLRLKSEKERWRVSVTIDPPGLPPQDDRTGQTVLTKTSDGSSRVRVPREVDIAPFWAAIDTALACAENCVANSSGAGPKVTNTV